MNISKLCAVGSLWLLVCAFALSNNQSFSLERSFVEQVYDEDFRNAPPVSHLTFEGRFTPAIMSECMHVLRARHSFPYEYESHDLPNIYSLIAKGDYPTAIEELKKLLSELGPIGEFSGYSALEYSEALATLGVAYELNGNWKEAVDVYTIVYGEGSSEFLWVKIRILYAVDRKLEAFKLICDAIGEVEWASPVTVKEKVERLKEERSNKKGCCTSDDDYFAVLSDIAKGHDAEWSAIWILRDNCARVICPEAPYVSSNFRTDVKRGGRFYFDLQKESFEALIDFMEEQSQIARELGIPYRAPVVERRIEYLKEINQIPYK